jgi:hypothetical protein
VWRYFAEPVILGQRRNCIFTKDVMAGIPGLVHQGFNAEAIADRLGCTVGTLRVRCSQAQISLRVSRKIKFVRVVPSPKPPKQKHSYSCSFALPTTLQLSQMALSRLRRHAEAIGTNEAQLARDLLETIAQDDLYDAVLDKANARSTSSSDARSTSSLEVNGCTSRKAKAIG